MIPYGKHHISAQDIATVNDILQSDWLTQGPTVPAFEHAIANYCQATFAVACNSATSALHIACLALNVSEGDIVWTSPISFVASANCALYCGATVDFVDINSHTINIDCQALAQKLQQAEQANQLPKVLIVVHMAGIICDMQAIAQLAERYQFYVIEDASHAIGARYQQQPVGNCAYSDITVFSFHPVKIITTAEGGLATTNDEKLADKMALYRSHGIIKHQTLQQSSQPAWYYEQHQLGFNYRLTDIQAALGLSQLKSLDKFIEQRQILAARYKIALAALPVICQFLPEHCSPSYHLFIIQLTSESPLNRLQLFNACRAADIGVNVHYIPIHTQPYYQKLGFKMGDFPEAERYYQNCLSLPMYPTLTNTEFEHIIHTLKQLLSA